MFTEYEDERWRLRELARKAMKEYAVWASCPMPFVAGETPIPASGKFVREDEYVQAAEAVMDGWWTEGRYTYEFEELVEDKIGVRHAIMVNSGSSANFLALLSLMQHDTPGEPLKRGDKVLTTAAGFPTTINPIIQLGLTPVFMDVNPMTLVPDEYSIMNTLSESGARAVFLAHTLGNPWDVILLKREFPEVWFIEDNCDALGSMFSMWEDRMTGSVGHLSTLSFYPAHHMTTGEGGMVLTDSPRLNKIVRSLRDWGRDCWCPTGKDNTCGKRFEGKHGDLPENYDHKYVYSRMGFNMKSTDMNAAIGVAQMKRFDWLRQERYEAHEYLTRHIAGFDNSEYLYQIRATRHSRPSWFGKALGVRADAPFTRADIIEFLNKRKIGTRMVFAGNYLHQPAMSNSNDAGLLGRIGIANYKEREPFMPGSQRVMNEIFWIGCWPEIANNMLDYLADSVGEFLAGQP